MNQYIIKFLVVALFVATNVHGAAVHTEQSGEESQAKSISDISPEFAVIQKVYDDCQGTDDFVKCLKGKALHGISRAIEQVCVKSFSFTSLLYIEKLTPSSHVFII